MPTLVTLKTNALYNALNQAKMQNPSSRLLILFILLFSCALTYSAEIQYEVEFKGVDSVELTARLNDAAEAVSLRRYPPATLAALRQRAESDIPELTLILRSFAYYNARINIDYRQQGRITQVIFDIDLGPAYPLKEFNLIATEDFEFQPEAIENLEEDLGEEQLLAFTNVTMDDLSIEIGDPATATAILCAEDQLIDALNERAFPLAQIDNREVLVDQSDMTVIVNLHLTTGPQLKFGEAIFEGLETVNEDFVQGRVHWSEGELFQPCRVDQTRVALEETGVFSMVSISTGEYEEGSHRIPMVIQVEEARHRTVGAGINYSTLLGPGFTSEWESRNFRGNAERVSLNANINMLIQEAILVYRKPDFLRRDQYAVARTELRYLEVQGFTERSIAQSLLIERLHCEHLEYSYGFQTKYLNVTRSDNDQHSTLLKLPLRIRWSNADSLLDPCRGQTYVFHLTPTHQLNRSEETYLVMMLSGMLYEPVFEFCSLILAQKLTIGSIVGADRIDIPPPDRLYAGDNNLLRGYNYLTVSPLDTGGDPIGGRSLIAYASELRYRSTENLSLVGFFEIGNVYKGVIPDFDEKLLKSVGVGVRYHTPVGPLRVDLAYPIDRRPGVDDSWQVYIGIGQAF